MFVACFFVLSVCSSIAEDLESSSVDSIPDSALPQIELAIAQLLNDADANTRQVAVRLFGAFSERYRFRAAALVERLDPEARKTVERSETPRKSVPRTPISRRTSTATSPSSPAASSGLKSPRAAGSPSRLKSPRASLSCVAARGCAPALDSEHRGSRLRQPAAGRSPSRLKQPQVHARTPPAEPAPMTRRLSSNARWVHVCLFVGPHTLARRPATADASAVQRRLSTGSGSKIRKPIVGGTKRVPSSGAGSNIRKPVIGGGAAAAAAATAG